MTEHFQKACGTLTAAPDTLPNPAPAWTILLICILVIVMDLAVQALPGVPVLQLKNVGNMLPEALIELLRMTHGPAVIKGKGFRFERPCCIRAVTPLGAAAPSTQPEDYFGGYVKIGRKKKRCWLPLRNSVVAVAPNVPQAAWSDVLEQSRLAIPIFCTAVPRWPNRTVLMVDGTAFQSVDQDMLKKLKKQREPIYLALKSFDHWLRHKKRRWKQCVKDMITFYPKARNGRFTTTVASDEACVMALALAVFKSFLRFSVKEKWIEPEDANEFLAEAWRQVLPESFSKAGTSADTAADAPAISGEWNEPTVFWTFLGSYLQENQQCVSMDGAPCEQDTVAVVHKLANEAYLIFPREQVASAYAEYLSTNGIPKSEGKNWGVTLQHAVLDWGIQVKIESNNVSWRFGFYSKTANGADKVPCLAFPLTQLPETITNSLLDWFGEAFGRWLPPEAVRNEAEVEKVPELAENE